MARATAPLRNGRSAGPSSSGPSRGLGAGPVSRGGGIAATPRNVAGAIRYSERRLASGRLPPSRTYRGRSLAYGLGKAYAQEMLRHPRGFYDTGPKPVGVGYVRRHASGWLRPFGMAQDAYTIIPVLATALQSVLQVSPRYVGDIDCGITPTHVTGLNGFNACGDGVVPPANLGQSANSVTVWTWRFKSLYGQTGNWVMDACQRYTRPYGFPQAGDYVRIAEVPVTVTRNIPRTVQLVGPATWAPPMSAPVAEHAARAETEEYYGGQRDPLGARNPAAGTAVVPAVIPLPGTQVITDPAPGPGTNPGPRPAVRTNPKPGLSRKPGRRTKEQKFSGKKGMLHILRMALAVTEINDTLQAVADAIPDKYLKECKKAAKKRYWDNRHRWEKEGKWNGLTGMKGRTNWGMTPQEAAACIWKNAEHLEFNHVFYNVVRDQLQDLFAGMQYAALDEGLKSTRNGPGGGVLVTKNPYEHKPIQLPEWDDPFWDEVGDWLEEKEWM